MLTRLRQLGMQVDEQTPSLQDLVKRIKEREASGYSYEGADGSLWVLAQGFLCGRATPFSVERFRLISERRRNALGAQITESEATVSLVVGDQEQQMTVALGQSGPVDALNRALRKALLPIFPSLKAMVLSDYKVRILNSSDGTRATTRVLIDWTDDGLEWTTVGVSPNILNASLEAIVDGIFWRLFMEEDAKGAKKQTQQEQKAQDATRKSESFCCLRLGDGTRNSFGASAVGGECRHDRTGNGELRGLLPCVWLPPVFLGTMHRQKGRAESAAGAG